MLAILNANGKPGSYFPVSMALTVCRDTCSCSASVACDHSRSARKTRKLFFTGNAMSRAIAPLSS